ncbi:MAG: acyl-CoA reductase [Ferruginibacter sp.]
MNLQERIFLLKRLGEYIKNNDDTWQDASHKAGQKNGWFTEEFINTAAQNIANNFLNETRLQQWAAHYSLDDNITPKTVGVVMAGNIPLVGFHDFLCIFISGHRQLIKCSSKDDVLLKQLVTVMAAWNPAVNSLVSFSEMLKGCDAYIATGSNNSSRYFEQYFGKYPHIIRKNRSSAAILTGKETTGELQKLSDDIHLYFGLGCRNVTKIFVPEGYDFVPLLGSFDAYKYFEDHHKYKNNYDYQLSILLLNNQYYMTNGNTLLIQNSSLFSPISQLHYEFYSSRPGVENSLKNDPELQCIIGSNYIPFGQAQVPALFDYADGTDTMQFLLSL